ncbi:MAG: hypothetical protein ACR652_14085 [Methylocystis sp.]|uniref:hypothetical protein n=1 Tax=Methylocystis sp. TaxID=1911079 RepID=UPI003DA31765
MAERPEAYVVHETPSRLRLRVPARRRDNAWFTEARRRLSQALPGARIEANPLTGSILICAPDAARGVDAMADGPFRLCATPRAEGPIQNLSAQAEAFNERVRRLSGGFADARTYIVAGLVLTAFVQIARGQVFAPAVTLLWYAGQAIHAWTPSDDEARP